MDRPTDDDEGVLYVKSMCMSCLNRTYSCPYCDGEGKTYIEAADKTVARWISGLNDERKNDILESIMKGSDK